MAQGRSLWNEILRNFINSLKPRRLAGEFKGKDYLGNKYYESVNSSHGRRQRRWFTSPKDEELENEIPTEWEAWLRHKRKLPPTEEEIQSNILKMEKVKENARRLEMQRNKPDKVLESKGTQSSFPTYEEYSSEPFNVTNEKKSP